MKRCPECREPFEPCHSYPWNVFCSDDCLSEWRHHEGWDAADNMEPEEEDDE